MEIASFWERTNYLIKLRKTTQRAISKDCGFTERRIETLVSNERLPDAIEAFQIAQALGTSVEYLVTGEDALSADMRELLADFLSLNDDGKKAALAALKGFAAAYPKKGKALSGLETA